MVFHPSRPLSFKVLVLYFPPFSELRIHHLWRYLGSLFIFGLDYETGLTGENAKEGMIELGGTGGFLFPSCFRLIYLLDEERRL